MYKPKRKVHTGEVFGRWVVVEYHSHSSLCRCECGTEKVLRNAMLRNGNTTTCKECMGYVRRGVSKDMPFALYTRLAGIVDNAIRRCTDLTNQRWKYYGGRGIKVHEPWLRNKKEFLNYLTTLPGYDNKRLVIDRINNDGNYEPNNLRFATASESTLNRRRFVRKVKRRSDGMSVPKER